MTVKEEPAPGDGWESGKVGTDPGNCGEHIIECVARKSTTHLYATFAFLRLVTAPSRTLPCFYVRTSAISLHTLGHFMSRQVHERLLEDRYKVR
jgi:hypothetical protein